MEVDFVLWFLALLRAAIKASAVVLLIILFQGFLNLGGGVSMKGPAILYEFQGWIEQTVYIIRSSFVPERSEAGSDNHSAHKALVALGALLLTGFALAVLRFLYTNLVTSYLLYRALKKQGLKGVTFRPFLGQIPEMQAYVQRQKRDPEYAKLMFPEAKEAEQKYGLLYLHQVGSSIRVVVTDPAAVKEVLVTKARSFEKQPFVRRLLSVLGNGLVFSEGALWERQRKMINPAFSHAKIKAMTGVMTRCANEAADRWCAKLRDGPAELDMQREFAKLALDVVGRAAFGSGDTASDLVSDEVYSGLNSLIEEKIARIFSGLIFIPGYSLLPTRANRSIWARERKLRGMGLRLIRARRAERERGVEKEDLLGLMLAAQEEAPDGTAGKGMTDQQLMDECMTFLLAGHETTAILLTWTTYVITKYPEFCERCRKEVLEVLAGRAELPYEELHKLRLLQCVLYESLRLFPPVPILGRVAVEDVEVGGYKVPRGAEVTMMSYPMHTREALWGEDAMNFRPERFANGIAAACKNPMAFLPFSTGPRNCIGQNFALTEVKLILVKILRTFSLRLAPGYRHAPTLYITMKPAHGLPIILEKLENAS